MRSALVVLLCLLLLCSCSRIPEPAGFEYSSQSKMQAAHHWDVLAMDVANQINNELLKDDLLNTAVYVRKTCGQDDTPCKPDETTPFDEGFHDLLVTQLVHYGIPTSIKPEHGVLTVNYKVQTVYHQANRVRTLAPGTITALTAAVEVLRNAPSEFLVIGAAGAIDLANTAFVQNGHYEIIITVSIVNMRQYLFRTSNIYYINDEDFWHYQMANGGKAKEIGITNSDYTAKKKKHASIPNPTVDPERKAHNDPTSDI